MSAEVATIIRYSRGQMIQTPCCQGLSHAACLATNCAVGKVVGKVVGKAVEEPQHEELRV